MKYGWIKTNILDMWHEPKYNSERINQLLFCDPVAVIKDKNNYFYIEKNDGYTGWVDKRFVRLISKIDWNRFRNQKKQFVTAKTIKIFDSTQNKPIEPFELFYGTELNIISHKNSFSSIKLPDGNRIVSKSSGIQPICNKKDKVTGDLLVKEARRFIGIPYLWGGITSVGFDCSGLVQTIFRRFGIDVPRDTKQQINAGTAINKETIRTGDLLFFERHVGFAIGRHKLIHASIGGNGVRINSLKKGEDDFREDLATSLKTVRRIV